MSYTPGQQDNGVNQRPCTQCMGVYGLSVSSRAGPGSFRISPPDCAPGFGLRHVSGRFALLGFRCGLYLGFVAISVVERSCVFGDLGYLLGCAPQLLRLERSNSRCCLQDRPLTPIKSCRVLWCE